MVLCATVIAWGLGTRDWQRGWAAARAHGAVPRDSSTTGFIRVNENAIVGGALVLPSVVGWVVRNQYRNLFPEPFDVFDHLGNVTSLGVGWGVGLLSAHVLVARDPFGDGRRVRPVGAAWGALTGLVMNVLAETPAGEFLVDASTFDGVDFAYGLISATIGGAIPGVTRFMLRPPEPPPEELPTSDPPTP